MSGKIPEALQVSCVQMDWAKSVEFNLQRTRHYIQEAASAGSRVVLFPEANLTSYYFPYLVNLSRRSIEDALKVATRELGRALGTEASVRLMKKSNGN